MRFTLCLAMLAMLAGTLLIAPETRATVLWRGDFETGNLGQWSGTLNPRTGARQNITVVATPTRAGTHAAQLVVHPDDLWPNGHNRVELHQDGKQTGEGQTTYFSWYFQLPANITVHED